MLKRGRKEAKLKVKISKKIKHIPTTYLNRQLQRKMVKYPQKGIKWENVKALFQIQAKQINPTDNF